jgi:hypothetical protein
MEFIGIFLNLVQIVPWIVAGCSLIASLTPTPKDDEWIAKYYKVIDWFALNIGKAKEK